MRLSDRLSIDIVKEDGLNFWLNISTETNTKILEFHSKSSSVGHIVSAFQSRVLDIILEFQRSRLEKKFDDSGKYQIKDSSRDCWEIIINRTGMKCEYTYSLRSVLFSDYFLNPVFIEGKFNYHSENISNLMLNHILFDIQDQVSKMTVKFVFEYSQQ